MDTERLKPTEEQEAAARAEGQAIVDAAEQAHEDREAATHKRAQALYARAAIDPMAVAAENAQLRRSVQGTYALLHALAGRSGGSLTVTKAEMDLIPDSQVLDVNVASNGDVLITTRMPNRAERRAKK